MSNGKLEIIQHNVEWFLRGDDAPEKLDEASIEHIEKMIIDGYNQGSLCYYDANTDREFHGWWEIKSPQ